MNGIEKAVAEYGCYVVSAGSLRPQDLIPAWLDTLRELAPAAYDQLMTPGAGFPAVPSYADEDHDSEWWQSDECSWLLNETLFDALNEHAPEGYHFGSHEGDGACFGFWRTEEDE